MTDYNPLVTKNGEAAPLEEGDRMVYSNGKPVLQKTFGTTRVLVDPNDPNAANDGNPFTPFSTFAGALAYVKANAVGDDYSAGYAVIELAEGFHYAPSITLDNGANSLSVAVVGRLNSYAFNTSTPSSVLYIAGDMTPTSSAAVSYLFKDLDLAGSGIELTIDSTGGSPSLGFDNCSISCPFDIMNTKYMLTIEGTGVTSLFFRRCRFVPQSFMAFYSIVASASNVLFDAEDTYFIDIAASLDSSNESRFKNCAFSGLGLLSGGTVTFEKSLWKTDSSACLVASNNVNTTYNLYHCSMDSSASALVFKAAGTGTLTVNKGNLLMPGTCKTITGATVNDISSHSGYTASRVLTSDASGNIVPSAVTTTALGYLDATSSIQTQLNAKQASITGAATTIASSDLTASRVLVSDSSGKVAVSSVTSATLAFLDATSSIQTQLNAKQATITGAASTVTNSDLSTSKALVSNSSGKIAASSVTSTQLSMLSTVSDAFVPGINLLYLLSLGDYVTNYLDRKEQIEGPGYSRIFDDFDGATAGGRYAWASRTNGTAAAVTQANSNIGSTNRAMGVIQFSTGTTSTGRAGIDLGNDNILLGESVINLTFRVMIPTLSTSTQRFKLFAGLFDATNAAGAATDGIYVTYTDNENSGAWVLNIANNGSVATFNGDAGSAPAAGTWYEIFIVIASDGSGGTTYVYWYINNSSQSNSTNSTVTTMSTGAGRYTGLGVKLEKSVGTTARTLLLDYVNFKMRWRTGRDGIAAAYP